MVAHHQGAIAMAQYEIESGQYPPAIAISQSIVTSQRKEIDEMQAILRRCNQCAHTLTVMPTELRYERWFLPLSTPLGLGPKQSDIRIEDGNLYVAMGWGFRATIPLSSIKKAEPNHDRVYAAGVHGRRGRWLVNGSSKGMVELTIDPPVRAHAVGVPITLRTLWVSVTDPDALIAAVAPAS